MTRPPLLNPPRLFPPRLPLSRRDFVAGSVAAGAALLAGPVAAATEIGLAVASQGTSTLLRGGAVAALMPEAPLYEGDLVRTDVDGRAELSLNTATRINLGPQSEVTVDRYVADIGGVITIGGAMVFDRPDDLPPLDLTVDAAFFQIGVRGTRFFVGPSNGVIGVFVERGSVEVRAGSTTRRLTDGEGLDVVPERAPMRGSDPGSAVGSLVARPGPSASLSLVARWKQPRIDAAFDSVGL